MIHILKIDLINYINLETCVALLFATPTNMKGIKHRRKLMNFERVMKWCYFLFFFQPNKHISFIDYKESEVGW